MTKVSVVVPSYGRPEMLKKSLRSVQTQSYDDWELIVVDDNGKGSRSQLETAELMKSFKPDRRISYLVLEKNCGGSAARNHGWRRAEGKYICFLDNDDEFYPKKLERQLEVLEQSDFQLTVCRFDSFRSEKKVRTSPIVPNYENFLIPFAKGDLNFAAGSTMMVSKSLLEEIGGYDPVFRRKQDVELMIRLLAVGNIFVDDRILVRLNIDDRANVPNVDDFKKYQQFFNLKFSSVFESFPEKDRLEISQYNQMELAKVALWNKNVPDFAEILFNPELQWKNKFKLIIDLSRKFITYHIK